MRSRWIGGLGALLSLLAATGGRPLPAAAQPAPAPAPEQAPAAQPAPAPAEPAPGAQAPPSGEPSPTATPAPGAAPAAHAPPAPDTVAPGEAAPGAAPPDGESARGGEAAPNDALAGGGEAAPTGDATADADAVPAPAEVAELGEPAPSDVELRYHLERIDVRGNRTRAELIRRYVPVEIGESFDVEHPQIEAIRYRLMGTGWFDDVHLHLERGSRRGWVVLVIEVEERNTLVISQVVAGLARVVTKSSDEKDSLRPYGGLGVREHNLFGLGVGVGATVVVSEHQTGVDLRYHDPTVLGSKFNLDGRFFYNDAREFFGLNPLVSINCPAPDPDEPNPDPCDPDVLAERAVVIYDRGGVSFGAGREITSHLRYQVEWLGELVDVEALPEAASNLRGTEIVPIDFYIDRDLSVVSTLRVGFVYDQRDDPALPSQGQLAEVSARFGAGVLGSDYDFSRFEASFHQYIPLPWRHVLKLGAFAGSVFGRAPFFYRFYAADLSDLLPSRVLELNLDHRRTHNLLGTSIIEQGKAELAGRIDFEYQLPLHRGGGDVRGVDAYFGAGLFLLADRDSLRVAIPGYEGLARIPVDLTFDLGVQADTSLGLFKVGFSTLVGFLPDLGQDTR